MPKIPRRTAYYAYCNFFLSPPYGKGVSAPLGPTIRHRLFSSLRVFDNSQVLPEVTEWTKDSRS